MNAMSNHTDVAEMQQDTGTARSARPATAESATRAPPNKCLLIVILFGVRVQGNSHGTELKPARSKRLELRGGQSETYGLNPRVAGVGGNPLAPDCHMARNPRRSLEPAPVFSSVRPFSAPCGSRHWTSRQ